MTKTAAHDEITTNRVLPGQIRVTQMTGATVNDNENKYIGDVKDIILDHDGRVAAVVLDISSFLGMGGRYVAVPITAIKVSFDESNKPRFTIDKTREQLTVAQGFDLNEKAAETPPRPAESSR